MLGYEVKRVEAMPYNFVLYDDDSIMISSGGKVIPDPPPKLMAEARAALASKPTVTPYSPDMDIRNAESLPKGTGARYLLVIPGFPGNILIAKQWKRKIPKTIKPNERLIDFGASKPTPAAESSYGKALPDLPEYLGATKGKGVLTITKPEVDRAIKMARQHAPKEWHAELLEIAMIPQVWKHLHDLPHDPMFNALERVEGGYVMEKWNPPERPYPNVVYDGLRRSFNTHGINALRVLSLHGESPKRGIGLNLPVIEDELRASKIRFHNITKPMTKAYEKIKKAGFKETLTALKGKLKPRGVATQTGLTGTDYDKAIDVLILIHDKISPSFDVNGVPLGTHLKGIQGAFSKQSTEMDATVLGIKDYLEGKKSPTDPGLGGSFASGIITGYMIASLSKVAALPPDKPTRTPKKRKPKPLPADAINVQQLTFDSELFTCYGKPVRKGYRAYCRKGENQ